jgi:hypothetical protein
MACALLPNPATLRMLPTLNTMKYCSALRRSLHSTSMLSRQRRSSAACR